MEKLPDDILLPGLSKKNKAYHLHASNKELAKDIIIVGNPDRLTSFKKYFTQILFEGGKREMKFCTGLYKNRVISVISSGMGTDNIDILLNEIALIKKDEWNKINILRLGTTGAIRDNIAVGSFIVSEYAIGLDGLLHHYKDFSQSEKEKAFLETFILKSNWPKNLAVPYLCASSLKIPVLKDAIRGIALTINGFYGPQIRQLHLKPRLDINFFSDIEALNYQGFNICNFEMEMAGIFGLSKLFGFNCNGICVALANRSTHTNVLDSEALIDKLISTGLDCLISAP